MSNQQLTHISTVEGLLQAAMNQIVYMKPETPEQKQAKEDAMDALEDYQKGELFALRKVFE